MVVFGGDLRCPIVCVILQTQTYNTLQQDIVFHTKKSNFPRCYCFKRPKTAIQFFMVIFFSLCRSTDHQTCFPPTPFLAIQSMNRNHHQTPTKFCQFLLAWHVLCHFFVLLFNLKRAIGSNSLPLATQPRFFRPADPKKRPDRRAFGFFWPLPGRRRRPKP